MFVFVCMSVFVCVEILISDCSMYRDGCVRGYCGLCLCVKILIVQSREVSV